MVQLIVKVCPKFFIPLRARKMKMFKFMQPKDIGGAF